MDTPVIETSKSSFLANKWLIVLPAILLGGAAGLTWANYTATKTVPTAAKSASALVRPSITSVVTGKSIDASGTVAIKSATFSKTDKSIVAAAFLKNIKSTDRLEMTKYYNGYLVESKALKINPTTNKYVAVTWSVTGTNTHKPGNYMVKFYLNGNLEGAKQYIVQ